MTAVHDTPDCDDNNHDAEIVYGGPDGILYRCKRCGAERWADDE